MSSRGGLVAEVLSASTESIDRCERLGVYQTIPILGYILLIRSHEADVDYYGRNVAGQSETESSKATISSRSSWDPTGPVSV